MAARRVREQEHQAEVQRLRILLNEAGWSTVAQDEAEHFQSEMRVDREDASRAEEMAALLRIELNRA